ncbi:solute carrier family 20 [Gilbertella persicaria]|uniref:Phosphate transporter n=1 Tax=Rhizopus stolonifer TaxID=4846 RepID=A0A367KVR9_RHIST|nr:solute carrier family 20 [Gilbertella persicaria]KAI8075428.1 solute carrier family 20 [Gilbertella persicaria]RCI06296.1 Na+/Pi symporter [Rhizopus stolonifer]
MQAFDYTWIFAVGMVVAFMDAFGIGANDVSNSFATSVSSGSLTLIQACVIACFTEFGGAVLLGAETAETIKGGILSVSYYVQQPEMLMLAMMCAIIGSANWVLIATRFGWPVSTTHSIVGAIIGVGISAFGVNSITWGWDGVAQIITSWFLSPVCAGIVAAIIYSITKYAILRRVDSFKWGIRLVPVYFFFTAAIEIFYIIYKAPGGGSKKMSIGVILAISFSCAFACALFGQFFFCPWVVRRIKGRENIKWYHMFVIPFLKKQPTIDEVDVEQHASSRSASIQNTQNEADGLDEVLTPGEVDEKLKKLGAENEDALAEEKEEVEDQKKNGWFNSKVKTYKEKAVNMALHGLRQDVRNLENKKLQNVHAHTELFEDDAEYLFSFLQIITACMASFAHGSNDVSNAIGPIASIYEVWTTANVDVTGKVPIPIWILVYGGIGIDIGLALMGYRVMRAMGNNITYFTPSRGFCAELSAALTVLTCSQIGLPVSTTHCITGASAAIGLCNTNGYKAVNWKMLSWCFFSWFITLPCAGLVSGLLFAVFANSPKFV